MDKSGHVTFSIVIFIIVSNNVSSRFESKMGHVHHSEGAHRLFPLISNCLKILEEDHPSDSSAIIRSFIQDNFCDFVNPVAIINPLIIPPAIILLFSCPSVPHGSDLLLFRAEPKFHLGDTLSAKNG